MIQLYLPFLLESRVGFFQAVAMLSFLLLGAQQYEVTILVIRIIRSVCRIKIIKLYASRL